MSRTLRIAAFLVATFVAFSAFAASVPVILSISPQVVIAGTGPVTLTVTGASNTFVSGATVRVGGVARTTTFVSSSQLTATILASDVANAGTLQITATNPGTVQSSALTLTVLPNNPTISSIDPATVPVGTSSLTLTVNGQNFASTAVVAVGGSARTTTFVNNNQLTAVLPSTDLNFPATLQITVQNPNQKTSAAVQLAVTASTATPTITTLSPSTVTAGGAGFTLTVIGTNFSNGATVKANGVSRVTTFVDAQHLTAQFLSSDIVTAGTINVTVVNPNGTTTAGSPLTVSAFAQPVILSLSPSTVTAGAAPFTLTISGSNFVNGTTVQINGSNRTATFVSPLTLTVTVTSADVLTAGQVTITVTTPAPNVAVSNQLALNVVSQFAPTVTSINPSTVQVASLNLKVLVNGSNFQTDDIGQVNGSARTTEFASATQLAITLLASDVASSGTLSITVARKNGSGVSAPVLLTVTAASAVAITGFNPASAAVAAAPFTLAVLGQNFTSTSVLVIDSTARATTFVSPTELRTLLTTADLATQRDLPVQVVDSGGVASPVVLFSVAPLPLSISSITPSQVISGGPSFVLTVAGTNLSADTAINVAGSPLATQLQADGTLTATVDSSQIASPGTLAVTVTATGSTSAPVSLTVLRPTITSVEPTTITTGASSATLIVHGFAFLSTSVVLFKGSEHTAVLNPDGTLTVTLSATYLADAGQYAVTVKNSPSSTSNSLIVELVSPGAPQIASLNPASLQVGASTTVVGVSGLNFVQLSVVQVNGQARATTFVSNTALTFALAAADLVAPGDLQVTVRNPDGSVSLPAKLTVTGASYSPPRRRAAPH